MEAPRPNSSASNARRSASCTSAFRSCVGRNNRVCESECVVVVAAGVVLVVAVVVEVSFWLSVTIRAVHLR